MNQSRHPDDSERRENQDGNNSGDSLCTVLELPFIVPVIFQEKKGDAAAHESHIVLTCSAYDDDCEE